MPAAGVLLLALGATLYGLQAPVRRALALLVAVTVLVPATLVVPNGLSPYPTFGRVVLGAVALNLFRRHRAAALPLNASRMTPVHGALAVLVAVSLSCGVALAAPTTSTTAALGSFAVVLEQLVFFTVVLVAVRTIDDPRWMLTMLGAVLAASASLAVLERAVDWSWGRFLFSGLPAQQATDPAKPLELRLGDVRVRAGAQFALQFAWVTVALLPAALTNLVTRRRVWPWVVVTGIAVLAMFWSVTRSAVPGLVATAVVLWLASGRQRRIGGVVVAGAIGALAVVALIPSLSEGLNREADEGSIESRTDKVPAVLAFVADDPWTGLGHNGLEPLGIDSTDNSFLLAYAETGVVGATALAVLLVVALAAAARGLAASEGLHRLAHAAALAGALALVTAGFAFDAFSLQGSAGVFWLLVAVAIASGERAAGPWRLRRIPARRLALPVVGAAIGMLVFALAPTSAARNLRVDTVPLVSEVRAEQTQLLRGRTLIATGCDLANEVATRWGTSSLCRALSAPGSFLVRLEAKDATTLDGADTDVRAAFDRVFVGHSMIDVAGTSEGRPTGATTAPLVLALAGAAVAVLWPARVRVTDLTREPVPT